MADVLSAADSPAEPADLTLVVDARRLAAMLCCGIRSVRTWDAAGKLPRPVRIGGRVVWRLDEIREYAAVAIRVALNWGEASATDVRTVVPIPVDNSPKLVRVVLRDLADAGILRSTGFWNAIRPAAHSRHLSVWRLAAALSRSPSDRIEDR